MSKSALAALLFSQMLAGVCVAQSVAPGQEFGRASGGEIGLLTKTSGRLSGSLEITTSRSHGLTMGGTIMKDRLWFFGSAHQSDPSFTTRFATALPPALTPDSGSPSLGIDARIGAQIGSRRDLAASFARRQNPGVTTAVSFAAPDRDSFLSLRYTDVVTDTMFLSATFRTSSVSNSGP